jgi:ribosome-associated translation inhibitor RaiA
VLSHEKNRFVAELTVHAAGDHILHGIGNSAGWSTSITAAVQKVLQQADKVKGKWDARKREPKRPRTAASPRVKRTSRP